MPREFLLQSNQTLWTPSYLFLLLPLESLEPVIISWKEIDSCAFAAEFIKKNPIFKDEEPSTDSIMTDSDSEDIVHFANKSVHKDRVEDVVVLAIHTGNIYSVFEVLKDETADSSFDGDHAKFSSFTDYFKTKYEIELAYPGQNLLLLKQRHKAHNLLVDFNGEGLFKLMLFLRGCKMGGSENG